MAKKKKKSLNGVIVKFELIDDYDNVIKVLAEKTFPDAKFTECHDSFMPHILKYDCWDKEVSDYVYDKHLDLNAEYDYADWENAPNIRQAFYNSDGELMFTEDEVNYEMNL